MIPDKSNITKLMLQHRGVNLHKLRHNIMLTCVMLKSHVATYVMAKLWLIARFIHQCLTCDHVICILNANIGIYVRMC